MESFLGSALFSSDPFGSVALSAIWRIANPCPRRDKNCFSALTLTPCLFTVAFDANVMLMLTLMLLMLLSPLAGTGAHTKQSLGKEASRVMAKLVDKHGLSG